MKRTSLVTISVLLILFSLTGCSWIFTNHGVIIPDDEYSLTEPTEEFRYLRTILNCIFTF